MLVLNEEAFNTFLTMIETDKLVITRANVNDAALLTKLSITTFRETFDKDNKKEDMDKYVADEMSVEKLAMELSEPDNIFFLAWYDSLLVGYAKIRTLKIPGELKDNNPMEIERIYVLQTHQDKKIGAALMCRCIDHAVAQQHDVVWLGVWEHNYKAVNFYKRWGFELFGSHNFVLGDDVQTDVLMKKMLR
jgi:ribosomal protein S18 acetylase RimI-like enzyme